MTLECPKCKSSIAREGQKFCYRCGNDLHEVYAALNIEVKEPEVKDSGRSSNVVNSGPMASAAPGPPQQTQVFGSLVDEEATTETAIPAVSASAVTARRFILLPNLYVHGL